MLELVKKFEHAIIRILIVMMALVVSLATIELGWIIIRDVTTPPIVFLEIHQLLEIFSFFLLILIGIELLETIKVYMLENVIPIGIVVEVALLALARKVIVLDLEKHDGLTTLALAALVAAIALAYLAIKRKFDKAR